MKKSIFFFVAFMATLSAFATVRTVSSNPSTIGQFSTIQAAIDASADSDTVYVYGSPNTYPSFTIQDKKITVIGPGWAPDKNLPLTATVAGANIRNSPAGGFRGGGGAGRQDKQHAQQGGQPTGGNKTANHAPV